MLFVVVLPASAWVHLQQAVGRQAFADVTSAFVSSQMPGTFHVEGVRRARLPHVEADRIRVETASGIEVMELRDATVELDLLASLRHAGPHITNARVSGGVIQIAESPNGKPWIERAFSSSAENGPQRKRLGAGSGGGGGPFWAPRDRQVMRIEDTSFEDLRVLVEAGGNTARLVDAEGRARIWLPGGGDVQMRYFGVSGVLHTSSSFLERAPVRGLALTVDPTMTSTVRFATRLDAYDAELTLAGHLPKRDGTGARICLWTGGSPMASLMGVGGEVGTSLFTNVSFDMRPSAAPDDPRCREDD